MKRQVLLMMAMFCAVLSYAQYTISGNVLTTAGAPVIGQTVWISTDSSAWNSSFGAMFTTSAVTNSSGAYSATMPTTTTSGHPIVVSTADCMGGYLSNTHTYAGVNITSSFTKCIPPTISGKITLGTTSTGASNAKVLLIEQYKDSIVSGAFKLAAIDSALTDGSGNYSMNSPLTTQHGGTLLLKAYLLPASTNYSSYLPTYNSSSLVWSGASTVAVATNVTASWALIGGTNPGGPGFIGGDVTMGANKSTAVGDLLPNRQIILTDGNDKAVAYTFSDAQGKFSFNNVPFGTYKILGDVWSKTSAPLTFTINASVPTVNSIRFEEKSKTFNATLFATSVAGVNGNTTSVTVYPNPVTSELNISGLEMIKGDKHAVVYDVTGKVVLQSDFSDGQKAKMNVSTLNNGLYVLQVISVDGISTMKFTK